MALGRISGPLLKSNLLRNGVDLAFETDLLYLDVTNRRIGVKTTTPQYPLDVQGTARVENLEITDNTFDVGNITLDGQDGEIRTTAQEFTIGTVDKTIIGNRVIIGDIEINNSFIENTNTNGDLTIRANGTGVVNIEGNTTITGNLHATGNISADGDITIGDDDTDSIVVNADIGSDLIPDIDNTYNLGTASKKWNTLFATNVVATNVTTDDIDFGDIDLASRPGNIIYVGTTGSDTDTGTHPQDPVRTITKAMEIAEFGDTIYIYPGQYQETFPINVKKGVTVRGHSLRSVEISPDSATQSKDCFVMQGESGVEEVTIKDFYYNSGDNEGYAFRFADNFRVDLRSPYVRNVTVITTGTTTSAEDPRGYDSGDAGAGCFLDGSVAHPASREATMLFHAVTFITPGVRGLYATNGARIEWLNSFTYFASDGISIVDGTEGIKGDGKTRIKYNQATGSAPAVGQTVTYYDTDGTTVLATGTIENKDGTKLTIDGKVTGFELPPRRARKTVTARGNAQLSTSIKKFGTASLLLDGTDDFADIFTQSDFGFETGDFDIEFFMYAQTVVGTQTIFDMRAGSATNDALHLYLQNNRLTLDIGETQIAYPGTTLADTTWYHIKVSKVSGVIRVFLDGTNIGDSGSSTNLGDTKPLRFGSAYDGSNDFSGRLDEIRVRKGVGVNANFSAPTAELEVDKDTVLMLHCNGGNGDVLLEDDNIFVQDVRFSGGGSAKEITLVDLNDFGGEMRSIGSACVYGNNGVTGDGPGVTMYLIGQNLAYIGVGKDVSNDNTLVDQNKEVRILNNANVYFSSVDHKGDFRVGELFKVEQDTGEVTFTNAEFLFNNNQGITFTDGSNSTIIDGSKVQVGNVRLSGDTIDTVSGDLNLDSSTGTVNILDDVNISGNLDVTGNVTVGGNITLGDAETDTIDIQARIDSDLIPRLDNTYNIGSDDNSWAELHTGQIEVDDIRINDNFIETINSNGDLTLRTNGTGRVVIDNIQFYDNTVTTSTGNLVLSPSTNVVEFDTSGAVVLPKGTTAQRPSSPTAGMLRFNTTTNVFEGYTDDWNELGGVYDDDRDTYITPELNPGDDDDTLRFYAGGSLVADVSAQRFNVARLEVDDIAIHDGTLETITTNEDLILSANGSGNVSIENFSFNGNVISNTVDGAVTTLKQTGAGYFKIEGTGGFVIPVGNSDNRHPTPEVGMMRYNYIEDRVEIYDFSNNWVSVAGSTGAVSFNDAEEIAIKLALTL